MTRPTLAGHYVQYGCGFSAPGFWQNYDASPTLRFEKLPFIGQLYTRNRQRFPENVRFGNIVSGLSEAPASCNGIYCSHILEHLSLTDCRTALRNTFDLLKPGGTFRMVLPDLETSVQDYVNDSGPDAAHNFMGTTYLGREKQNRTFSGFLKDWLGNSAHLWMWDYKALSLELDKTGFVAIRRALFGDCNDPAFEQVEDSGRWYKCLGIQCQKPQ